MNGAAPAILMIALIAGCPDDKDLMWCLKLKADAQMVLVDAKTQTYRFIPNEAMIEYGKRLREH